MKVKLVGAAIVAALVVAVSGTAISASSFQADGPDAPKSVTLYGSEGFAGEAVRLTRDVTNLQQVPASDGFDGTANDFARSIKTVGRWQFCMDAGYSTDCFEVDGEVADLGDRGGSVSSVRYLGPSQVVKGGPMSRPSPVASGSALALADADWEPMYRVDLYGNDYREFELLAGQDWRVCKAACDGDKRCKAWTQVVPGSTPNGMCYLKDTVPQPSVGDCCNSGIKGAVSAKGKSGADAIAPVMKRLGKRAGDAAERAAGDAIDKHVGDAARRVLGY